MSERPTRERRGAASVSRLQDAPSRRHLTAPTEQVPRPGAAGPRPTAVDLPVRLVDAIEEVICSAGTPAARSEAVYRLICEIDETTRWMLGHDDARELVSLGHLLTAAAGHRHRMVD